MVRLSLRAQSLYGKKIANSLKATERVLNMHCSCPEGQSCSVEVNELGRRQFEVVVTRPSPVIDSEEWAAVPSPVMGRYRRTFDRRASAERIVASLSKIVAAPLSGAEGDDGMETGLADIAVVDSGLQEKVEGLIIGCHMCSPFADIPLFVVLDNLREASAARTRYVFEGSPSCPRCRRAMTEHTLIDMETQP
jgi:hypothetical protein